MIRKYFWGIPFCGEIIYCDACDLDLMRANHDMVEGDFVQASDFDPINIHPKSGDKSVCLCGVPYTFRNEMRIKYEAPK